MDLVYENQKQLIEEFAKLIRNYNKDGKDHKKEISYYGKKLEQLEECWRKFDSNDTKLRDDKDVNMSHQYFIDESYDRTKVIYENQRQRIMDDESRLKTKLEERAKSKETKTKEKSINADQTETPTTKTPFADFEAISELQNDSGEFILSESDDESDTGHSVNGNNNENLPAEVKVYVFMSTEIRNAIKCAEKMNMHETQGMANAQLENLKAIWSDFRQTHREISLGEHKQYCVDMANLNSRYLTVVGKLNDLVHGTSSKQVVQLPKIKIPEFDGEPANWRAFKDLFDKIVHCNRNISDSIKIQYLKANLTGKAAKLVEHLPPTNTSYKKCYEILNNRYENERENVSYLIDEILDIEIQKVESSAGLKMIHDKTFECIMSIESIGTSVQNWDVLLVQILMRKLDRKTIIDYENKLVNVKQNQTLTYFLKYLENRFLALASAESKTKNNFKKNSGDKYYEQKEKNYEKNQKKDIGFQCLYCEKNHSIYKCESFLKLEPSKRLDAIKEKKLCFVCLQKHAKNECKSKFDCKVCNKKHNVLLHIEKKMETQALISTRAEKIIGMPESVNEPNVNTLLAATRDEDNLLATAMVNVVTKNGDKILVRAVVDMGSQSAMITERAHQALGMESEKVHAGIDGIEETKTTTKKRTELTIFPRFSADYALVTKALVMKKITGLKVFKDDLSKYEHLQNLQYADPTISNEQPIDILLGVADYARIVKSGLIKGNPEEPIAQNSELGWLIMGPDGARNNDKNEISITTLISNTEINEKIQNLFETPEINDDSDAEDDQLSEEEKFCEKYFMETTTRDANGRFIVSMPFKNNKKPELGESKKAALAVLFQLEKRFEKSPELKKQYSEVIYDAIERGHLVKLDKPMANMHYIPHHAVFKDSTTTKLRTVYNASQRTSNGKSLNEQLAIGSMKQSLIFELLMRWRTFEIAVIADIEKMYKQIKLDEKQHHLQIILWSDVKTKKIEEYKMTTVTFGLANSPYLAIRWLKEVAKSVAEKYPIASNAIQNNFYVDDHTGGAATVSEAIELYQQLKCAFDSVGCNLRKFVSNSTALMNRISENDKERNKTETVKVLGMLWNPNNDTLKFKISFDVNAMAKTKRQLVAEMATIFDPLGLVSPMVVKAKILLQYVWTLSNKEKKYNWDDELPIDVMDKWMHIKQRALILNSVTVARWINTEKNSNVQLHGYCDASQRAYAACIYVRTVKNNEIVSRLLVAKAKNAPNQTIPKLELCGAKLLTQLVKKVCKTMNVSIDEIHLWSDSQCVLGWIAANPLRYKKYVSTRILYIQKFKKANWHFIAGKNNPADCASRGIYGDELMENKLWWNGPANLLEIVEYKSDTQVRYTTENEQKIKKINALVAVNVESIIPKSRTFFILKKIIALVLRFINNCKNKEKKKLRVILQCANCGKQHRQ